MFLYNPGDTKWKNAIQGIPLLDNELPADQRRPGIRCRKTVLNYLFYTAYRVIFHGAGLGPGCCAGDRLIFNRRLFLQFPMLCGQKRHCACVLHQINKKLFSSKNVTAILSRSFKKMRSDEPGGHIALVDMTGPTTAILSPERVYWPLIRLQSARPSKTPSPMKVSV